MQTIEHKTTPIKNVADIIAFTDLCGPRFLEIKQKIDNETK